MDLFVMDSERQISQRVRSFSMDLAFGADENDFSLEVHGPCAIGPGCYVFVPGTEYGGVVTKLKPTRSAAGEAVSYEGQTWHGILNNHVIIPDPGVAHYEPSGDADSVMGTLIGRLGIGDLFETYQTAGVNVTGAFRYAPAYGGICDMLRKVGYRLSVRFGLKSRKCSLHAIPVRDFGDAPGAAGHTPYSATLDYRPFNHIVALGKGEGKDRAVVDLYADENGNISTTQTLTGLLERTYVYDAKGTDAGELEDKARDKLSSLRETNEVDIDLKYRSGISVGDSVTVVSTFARIKTTSTVGKLVVSVKNGRCVVTPSFATSKVLEDYD